MKNLNYIFYSLLVIFSISACQDDDATFGEFTVPTNLQVTAEVVCDGCTDPVGDGSGVVNFTATADNAITYKFINNGVEQMAPTGSASILFTQLGVNTYTINVIAYGTAGSSTSTTIEVEVLATYSPPADLLEKLVGDGSRTWRIKSEASGHFGLGPVGGQIPTEWYGAGPGEKSATGMYDDRYIFNEDGTFTHIVSSVNDDPVEDTSGTVFGRVGLIDELGSHNEPANGADIENYPYNDYSENWVLIAPGGVETISLSGLAFIGYYTGGNHNYEIFDRSVPNELVIKTTDGNNEFDWWFIITSEEEDGFQTQYTDLVWSDEFDVNGAPDSTNWTYDLGAGGWGNNESQTYTDLADNVIVEDGSLKIMAKADGGGYTSARLKSEDLYEFTYGRIEARAKLPVEGGTWPAIWMLGEDYATNIWPACGEIDIMEHVGNDPNVILGTVHHPGVSPGAGDTGSTSVSDVTEWHTYTVEWTPDVIKFLVDDTVYHTVTNSFDLPFESDMFLIMNIAMGGTLGGNIDPGFSSATMEIDYIRVYQ